MQINHRRRQLSILIIDVMLMYVSLIGAMIIRYGRFPGPEILHKHIGPFSWVFTGWIIIFYTIGLYRIDKPFDNVVFLKQLITGVLVASFVSIGYFYIMPEGSIEPKTLLAMFSGLFTVLFGLWRYLFSRLVVGISWLRVGVGFVGLEPESFGIIYETLTRASLGYDIRFVLSPPAGCELPNGVLRVDDVTGFQRAVEDTASEMIVMSDKAVLTPELSRAMFSVLDRRVRFSRLADFFELVVRRVPIGIINETWFLENIDLRSKKLYEIVKRFMDIVISFLILAGTGVLWPIIAIAVKVSSSGPVFFMQKRLGRFNIPFTMIKFRTMHQVSNDYKPTSEDDPRITKVGKFLRSTRLDELPQALNILKGEMSFIGPRPERPEIAVKLEEAIPFYRQRHLVKPGVTGWDQVAGEYHSPSIEDTYKKLQYDLYYIKNMSFVLDVSIFFKTVMTVLRREGR